MKQEIYATRTSEKAKFSGLEFWADSLPAKRGRGRPEVDSEPLTLRLPRDLLQALDEWRDEQPVSPKRADVLRIALVEWLKGRGKTGA